MKILKKGKKGFKEHAWEGKRITCSKCKCKFQLEKGDYVAGFSLDPRDGNYLTVNCPTCETRNCFQAET